MVRYNTPTCPVPMDALSQTIAPKNNKIVLVGGCFDVLHFGHISFLKRAKSYGEYLVVALESDENVKRRKGPTRPIHTQAQRKSMLEAVSYVNKVILLPTMTNDRQYDLLVRRVKPHVIAITSGDTYKEHKLQQAKNVGARLIVIPKIHTPSTSQLAKLLGLE